MQSRKESGFSLIEVMITSLILAIGLLGIVALQGIAKKSLADTDKQIQASFLARTALEELRADTRWLAATSSSSPTQDALVTTIIADPVAFSNRSNLNLCRNVAATVGALATVTVAVSWQIQGSTASSAATTCGDNLEGRRQVVLSSLISEVI